MELILPYVNSVVRSAPKQWQKYWDIIYLRAWHGWARIKACLHVEADGWEGGRVSKPRPHAQRRTKVVLTMTK